MKISLSGSTRQLRANVLINVKNALSFNSSASTFGMSWKMQRCLQFCRALNPYVIATIFEYLLNRTYSDLDFRIGILLLRDDYQPGLGLGDHDRDHCERS